MANMKRIEFYRTINGASPVEEFLETLGVDYLSRR
jgi:hypothetical protein